MNREAIDQCIQHFSQANFRCDAEFLRRFVAALTTKRFVILTGLSGSGKTKLAQSFARWITTASRPRGDVFAPGQVIPGDQVNYYVRDSDRMSVEFSNSEDTEEGTLVCLPKKLIRQWAAFIEKNNIPRGTPARAIRDGVQPDLKYSRQLNSFETHLRAAAFALLAAEDSPLRARAIEVVAVGADWTSNEHVLGYPDGLDPKRYVRTKTLDLILNAAAAPEVPHFLILDEMNLSHVERYFADLLSAIESGEPIHLHGDETGGDAAEVRSGVPPRLRLPENLFIIGTVNVDETTYLFSPKVLDRANVLEFRASETELDAFLKNPAGIDDKHIDGKGVSHASGLMKLVQSEHGLTPEELSLVNREIKLLFRTLQPAGGEFGFRVAKEIVAFVGKHKLLSGADWTVKAALDAQIVQKILPKLHGSRHKLEPLLWSLACLCYTARPVDPADGEQDAAFQQIHETALKASELNDDSLDPLGTNGQGARNYPPGDAHCPVSFDKILRMLNLVRVNGFTSFAEG